MKYIWFFLILSLFLKSGSAVGQTELEIKTTGKFLYSWAIENDEITARENARIGLLDTIFVSLLKESAIDKTDTVFIKVIDYFAKQVGFKWQAIAFADKADIRIKLEQRQKLKVIPVIVSNPTNSEKDNLYAQVAINKDKIELNKNQNYAKETNNPVLDELLVIREGEKLMRHLLKLKAELKLNYGSKSHYPDDSACYIFIINSRTNYITAIYDKGSASRKNMFTDEMDKNYATKYPGDRFVYVVIN